MKKRTLSFLLFFVFFATSIEIKLFSQRKNDSLWYYYNLFSKANSSKDLIKAYEFYNKSKDNNLENGDTIEAIQNLRYIASIQKRIGHLNESELSAVRGIEILDYLKYDSEITDNSRIGLYNHLGNIYTETKNYEKAIDFYNKSLNITKSFNQINIILNNIAFIYKEQKDYEKAYSEFQKVYNNSLKTKDKKQIARALSNLGFVKSKLKYSDAILNLKDALKVRKEINHFSGVHSSYLYLTEYYKDKGEFDKAKVYANKALEIANKLNNKKYKFEALSYIVSLNGNPKVVKYKELQDSIILANQLKENKFAAYKYDYTQAIINAKESELNSEREKSKRIVYQSIGIIVILGSISLFYIFRVRYKKQKLQEIHLTEARISRKVHDEVANDLYHVMNKLQNSPNTNAVLDDLDSIYNKTRDISKENSELHVSENFKDLLNDLLLSYNSKDVNVITKDISNINWSTISKEKKRVIYRVLQELMTNMKKHSNASLVNISFSQSMKKIAIIYYDNGIGCTLKKNNGLFNTENRMKSVNGVITFETKLNKGFKAKIKV